MIYFLQEKHSDILPQSLHPKRVGVIHCQIPEIIFLIPFRNISFHSAGISNCYRIGGDIPCHNASGTDYRVVSDGYTGKNNTVGTDPHIVSNMNGQRVMGNHFSVQGIYRVPRCTQCDIGSYHNLVTNMDLSIIY